MSIDYSDEPGWPATATPVRVDSARIFPRLVRQERREEAKEAHRKWLADPDNREKARAATRRWKAAQTGREGVGP